MAEFLTALDRSRLALDPSLEALGLALLLSFVLAQGVAWLYVWTHGGLSYSRTYTQSLVLLALVVTLVMFVIGDSLVTAFGLLGALAIIRFRNVLKDTRDTVFVFFVLVVGMAVGSQRHITAIVGTLAFAAVVAYLRVTDFGSLGRFDGHLSLRLAAGCEASAESLLARHCFEAKSVSVRQAGAGEPAEHLFQVRLARRLPRLHLVGQEEHLLQR